MAETVLITGGSGFIGSHLARRLKAEGHTLLLVDNLSTGRRSNVADLLDGRCRLIVAPAGEALADAAVMRGVDRVYHLAASVGVARVVADPSAMVRTNIDETAAALDAAHRVGARILIASSSEVYGKAPVLPLREDMELVYGPTTASRWSYGLSKAIDEHLALDSHRRLGLEAVVVRLFNTIGPRQVGRYGMVVPRFVSRAVRHEPIEVYGSGEQSRAFCDVRDVTEAMSKLLAPEAIGATAGRVFNVGSQERVTIRGLAERVIELAGSRSELRLVPYERVYGRGFEDPQHRVPDVSRLREAIGFEPSYALKDTLGELIALEREALEAVPAVDEEAT